MHYFKNNIENIPVPGQFTYPFYYTAHPLCVLAAEEVQDYLQSRTEWHKELQKGKMFGVLVVKDQEGKLGFLCAFSGNLAGSNCHDYFVPPVYDLLDPNGYFKKEEKRISDINLEIKELEEAIDSSQELKTNNIDFGDLAKQMINFIESDMGLKLSLSNGSSSKKKKKAAMQNFEKELQMFMEATNDEISSQADRIQELKEERKTRSAALQHWIFQQFKMRNAKGEEKDLCEIFAPTLQGTPPAGAGECAAPKLLQHAYLQGLQPIAMAEFWWGNSPKGEIRRHGYYYPSCRNKCEPILNFMMQGLDVEPNPLLSSNTDTNQLSTIYEDEYLLVVNKPAGMLSVPGKTGQVSVAHLMAERYPEATGPLVVHRLDMATSGLLLIAKTKEVHANLQDQFEKQQVKKRYIALLSGQPETSSTGFIRLPLCPDYLNRPLQVVDYEHGKPSVTRYELLDNEPHTRVAFYPETGRTHQLRVHAAHQEGLNCPILGDPLYGQPAERLYLHAERLEFRHPLSGKMIRIQKAAPF